MTNFLWSFLWPGGFTKIFVIFCSESSSHRTITKKKRKHPNIGKHPFFRQSFGNIPPPKKKQLWNHPNKTLLENHPTWRHMYAYSVSLLRSFGEFFVDSEEISNHQARKFPHQPSRFDPGMPASMGPLKGTGSVKPWPNSGRGWLEYPPY